MKPGNKDRWTSFFTEKGATTTLLQVTFLTSVVMAGLHIVSGILDLWLVIVFRKISNLPPDMNPLEDNLTSRGPRASLASKHKHKNSEITLVGSVAGEKKPGYLSGSTVSVDDRSRLSTATTEKPEEFRRLPFHHSRTDSETTFSPHNPDSARWSRQHFGEIDMYQQPRAVRSSMVSQHTRTQSNSPSKHASFVEYVDLNSQRPMSAARPPSQQNSPNRYSAPARPSSQQNSPNRYSASALPNAAPSNALVHSQQTQGLLNDNWFAVGDDDGSDIGTPDRKIAQTPMLQVTTRDPYEVQPLRMNPPTPPPVKNIESRDFAPTQTRSALGERRDNGNGELNRHLTVASTATDGSSVYSESAPPLKPNKPSPNSGSSPKAKYYGDLMSATRGVRGAKSSDTMKTTGTVEAAGYDSTGMCALGDYGYAPDPPRKSSKRYSGGASPRNGGGQGRVVSRTGVDIVDAQGLYPDLNNGYGMRGRRDVSGKVAEEGRGGRGWYWGRQR